MKIGLQENISLPLLFIDGIARCGKSAFSGIIPSLEKMEHIHFSTEIELIIPGLSLNVLDSEYARAILRIYFNELSYNLHLSRNVNFRPNDQTGVDNYPDPKIYYDRLNAAEGDEIVIRCRESTSYLPLMTHDLFVNLDCLDQMELSYKMLLLWRHPIDNIYSWFTRGWGERYNNDSRGFTLLLRGRNELYPWYAFGFEHELNGLNPMEKCVRIATSLLERGINQYRASSTKEKIHIMTFEDFCAQPDIELTKICDFLKTEVTGHTPRYLESARFPRKLDPADRARKCHEFEIGTRPEIHRRLMEFSQSYENNLYGLR